jgi:DNA-binding transcriptional MerR regulator
MNSSGKVKKAISGKLYHSISEVAEITGIEQHVLRYWESEFPKLKPKKNRAGNRQYREKDIKIVRYIKHLLHNDMYTVQGAKKKLMESGYKEVEGQLDLLSSIQDKKLHDKTGILTLSAAGEQKDSPKKVKDEKPRPSDVKKVSKNLFREIRDELNEILSLLK